MTVRVRILLISLLLLAATPNAAAATPAARRVVGGVREYEAQPGDSLTSIGARFGVDVAPLARANQLPSDARLSLGQTLRVENLHLVPLITDERGANAILINVPQRMLFLMRDGEPTAAFPIAAGRSSWRTPLGEFEIDERLTDKTWIVPPSIQDEMKREGKPVLTEVPPGPDNPLGRHWLGLAPGSCGIHSTNAPSSLYSLGTHGCIRLHPDNAQATYEQVAVGERVLIVYEPLLLAELPDGRICLEAHRDAYHRGPPPEQALAELAEAAGLGERIDHERASEVLRARDGIARDVSRDGAGGSCT